eukprot:CAMPEP_0174386272 /NCGR_PEP_ID=MMETSP0811_2-20130205/127166_1 /TAXON_ID=73025 ORGANISM="Eutreptiella gymnastica-like, Strain CCMP1594" /NCGR_SAMPLE_ID=MMETSP0811_2 /ASSEMBLY_ACC=CAM_ASM_000667 /LENGTH=131 /DNA_ID=CAMNT_0015540889 /DNA_START=216 /DNA_END=611 /DNA_ORIENTATION=+
MSDILHPAISPAGYSFTRSAPNRSVPCDITRGAWGASWCKQAMGHTWGKWLKTVPVPAQQRPTSRALLLSAAQCIVSSALVLNRAHHTDICGAFCPGVKSWFLFSGAALLSTALSPDGRPVFFNAATCLWD